MSLNNSYTNRSKAEKTILTFNVTTMVIIYLILCVGTTIFFSVPLGIFFTIVSISHLIMLFIYKEKIKKLNIKKDE